jgi:hypothetical protein
VPGTGRQLTPRQALQMERVRAEVQKALHKRHWEKRKRKIAVVYAMMVADLGGYCGANCPEGLGCGARSDRDATSPLQLHHLVGAEWRHHKVGPLRRLFMYCTDWLLGKLGVLCADCNRQHGGEHTQVFSRRRREREALFAKRWKKREGSGD